MQQRIGAILQRLLGHPCAESGNAQRENDAGDRKRRHQLEEGEAAASGCESHANDSAKDAGMAISARWSRPSALLPLTRNIRRLIGSHERTMDHGPPRRRYRRGARGAAPASRRAQGGSRECARRGGAPRRGDRWRRWTDRKRTRDNLLVCAMPDRHPGRVATLPPAFGHRHDPARLAPEFHERPRSHCNAQARFRVGRSAAARRTAHRRGADGARYRARLCAGQADAARARRVSPRDERPGDLCGNGRARIARVHVAARLRRRRTRITSAMASSRARSSASIRATAR